MISLVRHPDTPPGAIQAVEAELERVPGGAAATFRVIGDISRLVVPPPDSPVRASGLWQSTCFELFVSDGGTAYREYNFSPSGAWAAYSFEDHRRDMTDIEASIEIETGRDINSLLLTAKIGPELPNPVNVGLTAVIEESDGAIRYWATSFAPGEPDFHAAATRSLLFDGVSAE